MPWHHFTPMVSSLPACPPARSSLSPQASNPRMLRRLLERPCTLALLVGSQLAVMMYLSLGGFRSLSALFGREQGPTFDYSHPHDVYSNLSHLPGAPVAPGDPPARGLPFCPERSPFLGECGTKEALRRGKGAGLGLRAGGHVTGRRAELSVRCIWRFGGLSHSFLLPTRSWRLPAWASLLPLWTSPDLLGGGKSFCPRHPLTAASSQGGRRQGWSLGREVGWAGSLHLPHFAKPSQ